MAEPGTEILTMKGVYKAFGQNTALQNVKFHLNAREIHGLVGGNGAGKTTLMNVLYGLYKPDAGEITIHGQPVQIASPKDAIHNRIGMVHQHFPQIRTFTAIENIVLGMDLKSKYTMRLDEEEKQLIELCDKFGLHVDLHAVVENLPMGSRQKIEILKALYRGVEILILDEPTTNLTPQEVDSLFQSLRDMVREGLSIVFITHKLKEVLAVCDRISVLRNGQNVMTLRRDQSSEQAFIRGMVGDEMNIQDSVLFTKRELDPESLVVGEHPRLQMNSVTVTNPDGIHLLNNVTLEIKEQEILGVAGVAGNGQIELAETVMGVRPVADGNIRFEDSDIVSQPTRQLLRQGCAYIPEDSLNDGFLPKPNVAQNLILGFHRFKPYSTNGFMDWKSIFNEARRLISEYNIKTTGPTQSGADLSGGNIQRVMIARAFSRPCKLLVAHNPTRGLDIPSIDFIYTNLLERKKQGMSTLLLSENLDELLLLSDRIAVIYRGQIMGILNRNQFDKYEIGRMMSGVRTVA
ncbi:MAG: ABC transporter ATP-binding protein [Anaerolineaceae bacterium]|nr:ABC transporter ATP-binding protein [Anaerolineaceae bacterium]